MPRSVFKLFFNRTENNFSSISCVVLQHISDIVVLACELVSTLVFVYHSLSKKSPHKWTLKDPAARAKLVRNALVGDRLYISISLHKLKQNGSFQPKRGFQFPQVS